MRRLPIRFATAVLLLGLSGCVVVPVPAYTAGPYDPGGRSLAGAAIGAGAGAALGAIAGGGQGAVIGALTGGAIGALSGAASTPEPPRYYGYAPPPQPLYPEYYY